MADLSMKDNRKVTQQQLLTRTSQKQRLVFKTEHKDAGKNQYYIWTV